MYHLPDFRRHRNELLDLEDKATRIKFELWMEKVQYKGVETDLKQALRDRLNTLDEQCREVKKKIRLAWDIDQAARAATRDLSDIFG